MSRDSAGPSGPRSLADLVGEAMAGAALDRAEPVAILAERWENLVGEEIAAHCRPAGMKAGVLHADVDSSVWCQQLQLRTPEILAALRRELGPRAPTDLRLRVGYSRRPDESTTGSHRAASQKSAASQDKAASQETDFQE